MTAEPTFPDRFRSHLTGRALLPKHSQVLVAVSGRSDSMALLSLLKELARVWPLRLHVGHVQHGTTPSSAGDLAVVEEAARRCHLPFTLRRDPETAAGPGARRDRRTRLLVQMLAELRGDMIATGETAENAAEVLLASLLRGRFASVYRLRERTEHWVRPLLAFSHEESERYLSARSIPFRPPPDPFSLETEQGAIALLVLPILRRRFGNAALANLAQMERDLAEDQDFLDELALLARTEVGWLVHEHTVQMAFARWRRLPYSLQCRLLATAALAAHVPPPPAVVLHALTSACAALTKDTEQTLHALNFRRAGGILFITRSS